MNKQIIAFFSALCLLTACHSEKSSSTLKVAATPVPQAQMLEYIKPDLAEQGIDLKVVVMDDYNLPNRALADKEVDANFFQHTPFLEEQIAQFHYSICVLAKIHIEPMGVYSKKIKNLSELADNATIAIPNDPSNEGRALLLLQKEGLITLNSSNINQITIRSIATNPKKLKFQEIDAAMLPRTLSDVNAAVIPTNFALQAGLSPLKDAIAIEDKNSPYVNVIAIRCGDENRPDLIALKKAMTSEKMKEYILSHYNGSVVPAFDVSQP